MKSRELSISSKIVFGFSIGKFLLKNLSKLHKNEPTSPDTHPRTVLLVHGLPTAASYRIGQQGSKIYNTDLSVSEDLIKKPHHCQMMGY